MSMEELCQEELLTHKRTVNLDNFTFLLNETYHGPGAWKEALGYLDIFKLAAYIVIIVFGFTGNLGVVTTVAFSKSMRTTVNIYVANLAVADALICIMCMIPQAIATMATNVYVLGEFMCKFNPFIQMSCLTCSVLTLSTISCDRFMAIMFPLRARITKQRTSTVVAVIWVLSFLVSVPLLIVKKYFYIPWANYTETRCTERWPLDTYYNEDVKRCIRTEPLRGVYYSVVSITLFFLPVTIMMTAYSLVLWKLARAQPPGEQHDAASTNAHSRAKKKANKMVFFILVAFIICWTPLQGMVLYSAFGHNPSLHGQLPGWYSEFRWFSYFLAYANSFVNPIIYGGFNKAFREGFLALLGCKYVQQRYGRAARSRMTFTTATSPSRNSSETVNGANKPTTEKMEMKTIRPDADGELSSDMKETRVSI